MLPDGAHFKVSEFACHDGTPYPEEWADRWTKLVGLCDAIRERWGRPLTVVSGYRTPAHNAALIAADDAQGSHQVASSSQHVEGLAADLRPETADDVPKLLALVLSMHGAGELPALGGTADYPVSCWVHVDCRPQVPVGRIARWVGR